MITYLQGGWYTRMGQRRLRNEVVDGAIDTAGMLFRSAVPPEAISSLALKVRTLATVADPPHRRGMGFGEAERKALTRRLQNYTDRFPALQGFISDCLEHISNGNDLRALYLHLMHITQMAQLLMVAKLSGAVGGLFLGAPLAFDSLPSPPRPVREATEASSSFDDDEDDASHRTTSRRIIKPKKPTAKRGKATSTRKVARKSAAKKATSKKTKTKKTTSKKTAVRKHSAKKTPKKAAHKKKAKAAGGSTKKASKRGKAPRRKPR